MQRGTVFGIVLVFVVLTATVSPGAAAGQDMIVQQTDVDPDYVHIGIDVRSDGSAEWTIEYRVRLTDENETAAYEDIVADVENNSSAYIDRFSTRIGATVDEAESDTGRSMNASDFDVTASIQELPQTYGILRYTFVWEGFAATEGETIRVGDALRGFFLDSETTMTVTWSEEFGATTVEPSPTTSQEQTVTWEGPLEFGDGEPLIVLDPAPADTSTTPASPTPTDGAGFGDGSTDAILLLALVFGVLIVLVFIVVWYYRSREAALEGPDEPPAGGGRAESPPPSGGEVETPPDELLSNEERVTHFLEEHGGRAKQQEIVDGLGWTEAKTSQVLSSMADEGSIEKFRIGRENVVKLPEEDDL